MGVAQFALVAVSSFLTAIALPTTSAIATTSEPTLSRDVAFIESIVFQTSLRDFDRSRFVLRRQHKWFDWTSDGCSFPVIGGGGGRLTLVQLVADTTSATEISSF